MQRTWRTFFAQLALFAVYETANQLLRGVIAEKGGRTGIVNAQRLVSFEHAHGFWVEPQWQLFFRQTHQLLWFSIGWHQVIPVVNVLYALGHVIITTAFALWIFYFRTDLFSLVRNLIFAADALALIGYKVYPTAPPRLTPGLEYNGHPFHFVDTLTYWGANSDTNEFAAMPSIHIAYALIVGVTLALTLRPLALRLLALLYPVLMLVVVVVSANHYLMDAVGAVCVLSIGAPLAFLLYRWGRCGHNAPWRLPRTAGP